MIRLLCLITIVLTAIFDLHGQQVFATRIPGYTGYAIPGQTGVRFDEVLGCTEWTNPDITIQYHMRIQNFGQVGIRLMLSNDGPLPAKISVKFSDATKEISVPPSGDTAKFNLVDAGLFDVPYPGFYTVRIKAISKTGKYFPGIMNVQMYSTFSDQISFQSTPDRHASTVTLGYDMPQKTVVGMCVNATVPEMFDNQGMRVVAIGNETFRVGMANEKIGRYIYVSWRNDQPANKPIFTSSQFKNHIYDTSNVYRSKIMIPYNWEAGKPILFSIIQRQDTCSKTDMWEARIYNDRKQKWYNIATITVKENAVVTKEWYSSLSNTDANSGYVERKAIFNDQIAFLSDRTKEVINSARFMHDKRGKFERKDYGAGCDDNGFWLSTGGFAENKASYGNTYMRKIKPTTPLAALNLLVGTY